MAPLLGVGQKADVQAATTISGDMDMMCQRTSSGVDTITSSVSIAGWTLLGNAQRAVVGALLVMIFAGEKGLIFPENKCTASAHIRNRYCFARIAKSVW